MRKGKKGQRGSLVHLIDDTLVAVAKIKMDELGTAAVRKGWRGIGPVPPEKQRTANAAIQLLKMFEDG